MAGLATTFGSGAMTNSINEIENAELILASGSNATEAHPQVARRILRAVERGAKLIVIDPRRTELAARAHIHLALRPGSDIPLINGMMRAIIDAGLADDVFIEMRTENFHPLRDMLYRLDLEEVKAITGIEPELFRRAARMYAKARKAVICYCVGVTHHVSGTGNVQAYANLAMLTGKLEKEHTGVNPLRGQNNVQGACDMGALPNVLPGYREVDEPAARQKFEQAWNTTLPGWRGLTLLDMTHGGRDGPVRGLFITGENPMLSDPDPAAVEETLADLEILVVSDIFLTETAALADVVFPAASFAEKSGTFTNSERRIQMVRRAIAPLGECRSDSDLVMALAGRMGHDFDYRSSAEIMEEIALLVPLYGGVFHDRLEESWGLQWPCPDRTHPGTPYLHKYSFTRGRGRFMPAGYRPPAEQPDEEYPFVLLTGRVYHHYHTGTMSRRCDSLNRECSEAVLEINPEDGATLRVRNGEMVRLASRRGSITLRAELTPRVAAGQLYTTFHFSEAPVNRLIGANRDPISNCPEYKVCAVRVEKTS